MNEVEVYYAFRATTQTIVITIGFFSAFIAAFVRAPKIDKDTTIFAILLSLLLWWRLGWLPIGWGFSFDRSEYALSFLGVQNNPHLSADGQDALFGVLLFWISRIANVETFFIIQSAIYVLLYFWVCKRLIGNNIYWLLVGCAVSMGFISYGINTLRAGLAISFVLLGLSYSKSLWKMGICLAIGLGIHFSMSIPIAMILIAKYFDRTRLFFILWLLSIPVSFFAGTYFNELFAEFTDDSRNQYLINQKNTI